MHPVDENNATPRRPAGPAQWRGGGLSVGTAEDLGISPDQLCAFYRTHWARPIALTRPDFLRWQLLDAPQSGGRNHSVVAVENGEVLACMALNRQAFLLEGRTLPAAELTTWVVAEGARGKGVGRVILQLLQDRYDVLLGAGITQAALSLYLGAGFTFLAHLPRFVHVADFAALERLTPVSPLAHSVTQGRQARTAPAPCTALRCVARDLADLATVPAHQFRRNAAHLGWRYDDHPIFAYESYRITAPDGAEAGLILRRDGVNGVDFLHVVDVFGAAPDAALACVEGLARDGGAAFADLTATFGPLTAAARGRGWSSAVDDPFLEVPGLFYPVELRRPPTTSVVVWSRGNPGAAYDFGKLHLTKADLDMDRPTIAFCDLHKI